LKIYHDKSFMDITTFKIGGSIENLYYPTTTKEIATLLSSPCRFHVIGAGSKILAGDGPFENVICTQRLDRLNFEGNKLRADAGAYTPTVSTECVKRGLSGTEFLIDIPATVGGAVIMNAGFMGHEMSQICTSVEYVNFRGEIKEISDIQWARRWCSLQGAGVVTAATLHLIPEDTDKIKKRLEEYHKIRASRQPQGVASAGGIFVNHRVLSDILKTLPYLKYGDAEIVADCPNFIINNGSATFDEVMHLIRLIESHAQRLFSVKMKREVRVMT